MLNLMITSVEKYLTKHIYNPNTMLCIQLQQHTKHAKHAYIVV